MNLLPRRNNDAAMKSVEESIVDLVNSGEIKKSKVFIEKFQKLNTYIYDQDILKQIMEQCKFKDVGSIFDFPDAIPQPEVIHDYDFSVAATDTYNRLAVSNKYNSILFYSVKEYYIQCTILADLEYLNKILKKLSAILKQDNTANVFAGTDFHCEEHFYIEIAAPEGETKTKFADVVTKKLPDENLVFDKKSTINDVMNDITTFFTQDTYELYKKLDLPYKRGIILYGDPGNGKSAMIRQIIRTVPEVSKIVINPNVGGEVTRVLQSLTKALNGKKAMVIIEDIDSLITDYNRSQFLNILDGVDIRSGVYFIGTTNYPDKIDPAFMNRSGRFDRTYNIGNPEETTRTKFFESRNLHKLFEGCKVYKGNKESHDVENDIVALFVKCSKNLPMASLKELITSTAYLLASGGATSIEQGVKKSYNTLVKSRTDHANSHNQYKNRMKYGDFMFNGGSPAPAAAPAEDVELFDEGEDEEVEKPSNVRRIEIKRIS